jgi:hypothetical protein
MKRAPLRYNGPGLDIFLTRYIAQIDNLRRNPSRDLYFLPRATDAFAVGVALSA